MSTPEITQADDGFVTADDYATVDRFLADCGVSPKLPRFDPARYESFRESLAIYGAALTRAVRTQARDAALEEARAELPDEIDLFRAIRDAGRKNGDKAAAAYALIPPGLRIKTSTTNTTGD